MWTRSMVETGSSSVVLSSVSWPRYDARSRVDSGCSSAELSLKACCHRCGLYLLACARVATANAEIR
jgi:hypothetical protein